MIKANKAGIVPPKAAKRPKLATETRTYLVDESDLSEWLTDSQAFYVQAITVKGSKIEFTMTTAKPTELPQIRQEAEPEPGPPGEGRGPARASHRGCRAEIAEVPLLYQRLEGEGSSSRALQVLGRGRGAGEIARHDALAREAARQRSACLHHAAW